MRPDMAKVIVERPRYGSSLPSKKKGYRKQFRQTAPEDLARREPMLGRWHGLQRSLNEHLGPMKRFLQSNVGRPWNKVHRDLCEHVSFDNPVQSHVLDHIYDFVVREVQLVDCRPSFRRGWREGCPLPAGQMYVCCVTGLLKVVEQRQAAQPPERLQLAPGLVHLLKDRVWWEIRVRPIPDDPAELWDVWLERSVSQLKTVDCRQAYGEQVFAVSKRALTPGETKQLLRTRRELSRRRSRQRIHWRRPCH